MGASDSLSTGCRRRDRYTTNTGFLDRPGNQPRSFYVVDEFAQVSSSGVAAFGNPEGLLNRHKPTVEHPRSRELRDAPKKMLSHAGDDVHLAREDQFKGRIRIRRLDQLGVLQ